jgi:alkylated DNA repair protein (DNA oxidative demethylase)
VTGLPDGVVFFPGHLADAAQRQILLAARDTIAQAPLFVPRMPRTGAAMSVRMTNCGVLGWVTDKDGGYRYQPNHPATGRPWPPMPPALVRLWREVTGRGDEPQACLVNLYDASARMGMHQDRDEEDMSAPVVSVSLGCDCRFRIGGTRRQDPAQALILRSGDVLAFGGPSRLAHHGVDRIYPLTSDLVGPGERINLTLRRVTRAARPAGA